MLVQVDARMREALGDATSHTDLSLTLALSKYSFHDCWPCTTGQAQHLARVLGMNTIKPLEFTAQVCAEVMW